MSPCKVSRHTDHECKMDSGTTEIRKLWKGLLVIIAIGVIWHFALPHRYIGEIPMTHENAIAVSPIPLPESASNIYIATYRHWIALSQYVRFDAPVSDCISHVHVVTNHLRNNKDLRTTIEYTTGSPLEERFTPYGFKRGALPWFDVTNIAEGIKTFKHRRSWDAEMWIDKGRGRFYYALSD